MLFTDMRMEHDVAGVEVIKAARSATYHPAVALLTAFPVAEEDWQEMGADQLLVKPMHTRILLQQIEDLIASHERKLANLGIASAFAAPDPSAPTKSAAAKKKAVAKKKIVARKAPPKKAAQKKSATVKKTKKPVKKNMLKPAKKPVGKAKSIAKKTPQSRVKR
jgi:DNA-binding response OmpR family regulator